MIKFHILLLSLFLTVFLFSSCTRIIDPEFRRVEKFALKNADFQEVTVAFGVVYYNPNKFGVKVKEAVLDVYVDSVYIGKFTQPTETEVNELAEFSIPVEGKLGLQQAFKLDIPNLIDGREVFIRANGNIKIGKGGVYMNHPIHYEGRQTISADLLK
jgi:LEA14-like dessication related protein